MLTYQTFGARGFTCQINRIDQGFKELGLIESETPDFIYCNDLGCFNEAYKFKIQQSPNSKLILNILDIPEWNFPNVDLNSIFTALLSADKVTSISKYVHSQLIRIFNINSNIIYNPIKSITNKRIENKYSKYKYLMIGRLRDPSKRAHLAIDALSLIEKDFSNLAIVGSESIGCGDYLGIISDEDLNLLYNSVQYVLVPSAAGGIELPGIEACVANAIPILCSDLTTFSEFYPKHFGCYPNKWSIANRIISIDRNEGIKNNLLKEIKEIGEDFSVKFNYKTISENIIKTYDSIRNI